jgi:hypothetical protein
VPNKRAKGQTLIAIPPDERSLAGLDHARGRESRSQFVRDAICEKLGNLRIRLPSSITHPPDRASKTIAFQKLGDMEQGLRGAEDAPENTLPLPPSKPTIYPLKKKKGKNP